jgi:diguanylate cyclase (GGDEF)-like protein/PAS domain S-box-containing protein
MSLVVQFGLYGHAGIAGKELNLIEMHLLSVPAAVILAACGAVLLLAGWLMGRRSLRGQPPADAIDCPASTHELTMLRAVVASLPDLIYVKDKKSRFLLANQGTADVMGAATGAEIVGRTDFDFYPREQAEGFFADEQKVIETGEPLVSQDEHIPETGGKTRWILTTKVPLRDRNGKPAGIIGIGRNITRLKETESDLKAAREALSFKATHDALTSLLNREAILELLERELARSAREKGCISILLADLDHFKNVNDLYGHPVGDAVLRETAARLVHAVRGYDLAGRYGGEEFLVILSQCAGADSLARAEQIRQAVNRTPVATDCGPISVTISMGVLTSREWGYPGAEVVLREVDVALYAAKAEGRNRCRLATAPPRPSLDSLP